MYIFASFMGDVTLSRPRFIVLIILMCHVLRGTRCPKVKRLHNIQMRDVLIGVTAYDAPAKTETQAEQASECVNPVTMLPLSWQEIG